MIRDVMEIVPTTRRLQKKWWTSDSFFRPRPQGHSLGLDGSFCKECANARVQKDSPFVFFCGSRRNKRASSFTCNNVFAWKLTINVPVLGEQDRNIMVCLGVSPLVESSGAKIKITKKTMTIHVINLFSNSLHFTTHRTRKADGSVNGGWLGRVCTTLHLHAPYITHSISASFLFFFLLALSANLFSDAVAFADMGRVLTELLRAKYGAAARECVEAVMVGFVELLGDNLVQGQLKSL